MTGNPIDKQLLRQRFRRGLSTYGAHAEVQRAMAEVLLDLFYLTVAEREFETVTELGCGTGLLTDLVEQRFDYAELNLIDLVPECAAFHDRRRGARFVAGDIETVPLPPSELFLSNAALQWATDPAALLRRIATATSPGGYLAFTTFLPGNLAEIRALTGRGLEYLDAAGWRNLLSEAGFDTFAWHAESVTPFFPSPLEALKSLKSTGVTAVGDTPRWTRAALDRFCAAYHETFAQPEGYPLTYQTAAVVAIHRGR